MLNIESKLDHSMWVGGDKSRCKIGQGLESHWRCQGDPCPVIVTSKLTVRDETLSFSNFDSSNFQGWLSFDGSRVSMQYSAPRDQRYEQPKQLSDWTCAKVNGYI